MKTTYCLLLAILGLAFRCSAQEHTATRVLIVTGGHAFERQPFFKIFADHPEITTRTVEHPNAHQWFAPEHTNEYDVVLLYDMWQDIAPQAKTNFMNLLKAGKGLVAMHHCLAGYQAWPEYEAIIGGKYHEAKWSLQGKEQPPSTYKHDVDFTVKVTTLPHPVIQGLGDFQIHDETYNLFTVDPAVTPLLTTDAPTSTKTIAWAKTYGKSRVVYVALGHDHLAYENPNLRRFLAQAIAWTAKTRLSRP